MPTVNDGRFDHDLRVGPGSRSVSIVITCYNYEQFVGEAVRSALAQSYAPVEVIVVDDASTDTSVEVVSAIPGVRLIGVPHGGQIAAMNVGFAASTGDVVLFLDADDVLEPTALAQCVAAMADGVSKVQFRLRMVDAAGCPTGPILPRHKRIDATKFRRSSQRQGSYPTPPTTGNAFARWYLESIMPQPEVNRGDGEGLPVLLAPSFGGVIHLPAILGRYRVHGSNSVGGRSGVMMFQDRIDKGAVKAGVAERLMADLLGIEWVAEHILRRNPIYLGWMSSLKALAPDDERVADYSLSILRLRLAWARLCDVHDSPGTRARGALGALYGRSTRGQLP